MAVTTTRWDSAEYLKTEEDVQLYLEACLEEAGDDPAFIAHALDVINRSWRKCVGRPTRIAPRSLSRGETEHVWQGPAQNSHPRRHH